MNPYFTAVTPEYGAWGRFYCVLNLLTAVVSFPQELTAALFYLQLPVAEFQSRVGCKIYKFKV